MWSSAQRRGEDAGERAPSRPCRERREAAAGDGGGAVGDEPRRLGRMGRNGPRTTVRSGSSSSSALWTTPLPLWMSVERVAGERAPGRARRQVAEAGPRVDRDRAVAQLGDARRRTRGPTSENAGCGDDVGAERAVSRSLAASTARAGSSPGRRPGARRRRARVRTTRRAAPARRRRRVEPADQHPLGDARRVRVGTAARVHAGARAGVPRRPRRRVAECARTSSRKRCFCGQAAGSSSTCAATQLWPALWSFWVATCSAWKRRSRSDQRSRARR